MEPLYNVSTFWNIVRYCCDAYASIHYSSKRTYGFFRSSNCEKPMNFGLVQSRSLIIFVSLVYQKIIIIFGIYGFNQLSLWASWELPEDKRKTTRHEDTRHRCDFVGRPFFERPILYFWLFFIFILVCIWTNLCTRTINNGYTISSLSSLCFFITSKIKVSK